MTSLRSSGIWVSVAESELRPQPNRDKSSSILEPPLPIRPAGSQKPLVKKVRHYWMYRLVVDLMVLETETCICLRVDVVSSSTGAYYLLSVIGDPERIVYCGPSGLGQIVKGIN